MWVLPLVLATALWARAEETKPTQRPTARLRYARLDGAEACPSLLQTERAVAARLGYHPFRPDAKDVIEAFVDRRGNGLRARLELKDVNGTTRGKRELDSPSLDCSELSSALTLAIAIAIDPQAFLGGPPPPPPTPPIPVASAPPEVVGPPPPLPPLVQAEAPSLQVRVGAGLLGLAGTSPGVTGGLAVRVSVGGKRWSLALDARGEWPRSLSAGPGAVSVLNVAGLLAPCFHLSVFGACAVIGAGATRVWSEGLVGSSDTVVPFVQGGGRLQVLFPVSERFSLGGSVDLLVPITRAVLRVGDERLWVTPPFNGSLGLFVAFSAL